jgi:hypothetical protein
VGEITRKMQKQANDKKQKDIQKMGFVTPDLWTEHDEICSTTSDKRQELRAMSQLGGGEAPREGSFAEQRGGVDTLFENFRWQQWLIFGENSFVSSLWSSIDIFSCIVSSYFYAYVGTFGFGSLSDTGR